MINPDISIWLAFIAGLASFLSPCVFSLVPAYISYLGGRAAASAQGEGSNRLQTVAHAAAFVLGFSTVFTLLGLGVSLLGGALTGLMPYLTRIGGIIVVVFGLHMIGVFRIRWLEYDLRPQSTPDRNWGFLSSFMMGVFFSAGWSPCVGPVLGAILTLSFTGGSVLQGTTLLLAYSAGLAIPFLFAATQISLVTMAIRRYRKATRYIEIGMGALMVLIGAMLFYTQGFGPLATLGADLFAELDEVRTGTIMLATLAALALLGLIPAFIARGRGRNFFDWWFFGTSLFPVALVMALRLDTQKNEQKS
ncbi:MAG: cytochrome c biogenesis CcdA family protein [Chloroflexota bacterium]